MNKSDFVKAIATHAHETPATVNAVLEALAEITSQALGNGDDVTIPGIIKLATKERAARKGRNPKTGEEIDIAAKTVVSTKVLKNLADHIA